jgi:hypothetical protein
LQQLEVAQGQTLKDEESSHERAIEGLSGEELDKAKLDHRTAMQRMNDKFKMEQADVVGRVLRHLADKHKHEVALFDR